MNRQRLVCAALAFVVPCALLGAEKRQRPASIPRTITEQSKPQNRQPAVRQQNIDMDKPTSMPPYYIVALLDEDVANLFPNLAPKVDSDLKFQAFTNTEEGRRIMRRIRTAKDKLRNHVFTMTFVVSSTQISRYSVANKVFWIRWPTVRGLPTIPPTSAGRFERWTDFPLTTRDTLLINIPTISLQRNQEFPDQHPLHLLNIDSESEAMESYFSGLDSLRSQWDNEESPWRKLKMTSGLWFTVGQMDTQTALAIEKLASVKVQINYHITSYISPGTIHPDDSTPFFLLGYATKIRLINPSNNRVLHELSLVANEDEDNEEENGNEEGQEETSQ